LIDRIHHDENAVVDHVLVVKVIVTVIETEIALVVLSILQSKDNIIHNNQGMFSSHMYDDGSHVEQVVSLNKQLKNLL
jgi:hypothetical protein